MSFVPVSVTFDINTVDNLRRIVLTLTSAQESDGSETWTINFQVWERADFRTTFKLLVVFRSISMRRIPRARTLAQRDFAPPNGRRPSSPQRRSRQSAYIDEEAIEEVRDQVEKIVRADSRSRYSSPHARIPASGKGKMGTVAAVRCRQYKLGNVCPRFSRQYLRTWGALSEFLNSARMPTRFWRGWDYVFIGYDTGDVKTYLDISALICGAWRRAAAGDPPTIRNMIAWPFSVTRLGTLGIRQALCANSIHGANMLRKVHSVTLFGSPLNGSPLAPWLPPLISRSAKR